MKLLKEGLVKKYTHIKVPHRIVVLDPFSDVILHREDDPYGILVVDRSWKKLFLEKKLDIPRGGIRRRLPALKAANPINYSKLYVLSSAEALAASLYLLGCESRAHELLDIFKWGEEFFRLNNELLNKYTNATSREELLFIEKKILEKMYESVSKDHQW